MGVWDEGVAQHSLIEQQSANISKINLPVGAITTNTHYDPSLLGYGQGSNVTWTRYSLYKDYYSLCNSKSMKMDGYSFSCSVMQLIQVSNGQI